MTAPTAYELIEDMRALEELLEQQESEADFDAVAAWLKEIDAALEVKADRMACLAEALRGRAELRAREAKRLKQRADADSAAAERIDARLLEMLEASGRKSLETLHHRITVKRNAAQPDLEGIDPRDLPEEYRRHVPERWEAEKVAIGKALRAGEEVIAGGRALTLREPTRSLLIK